MIMLATLFRCGEPVKSASFIVVLGLVANGADCVIGVCYILGCMALYVMLLLVQSCLVINELSDHA